MTTCIHCEKRKKTAWHGYSSTCLQCAAALVITARPLKHLQEGHLYQATRRGKLTRQEILEAVKAQ